MSGLERKALTPAGGSGRVETPQAKPRRLKHRPGESVPAAERNGQTLSSKASIYEKTALNKDKSLFPAVVKD